VDARRRRLALGERRITVSQVDVNVRKLREWDLAWADVVFVSGMIAQRDLAHTLIARCRPSLFPLAVTLSIRGHHFRKTGAGLGL
jgi:hypothetical protein